MKKVEIDLVKAVLVREGLPISGDPEELTGRLKKHFASYPDHEMSDCSECGNGSPADDPACAFCGHSGDGDGSTLVTLPGVSEAVTSLGDRAEAERRLDAAIGRYGSANREMVGSGWDMGNAIREIRDGKLYLARRGAGDQPVHRNFEEFCRRELKTNAGHVNRMIAVAENYTREQALAIGTTKLGLVLKVFDEEKRAPLLEMASRPEVTVKQLAEATRQAVKDQPPRPDRLGRKTAHAYRASAAVFPPAAPVAPFIPKASGQVLFSERRKGPGDRRRAFELTDGPVARMRCLNGTQIRIRLFKGDKGIYAKLEFSEAPDEGDEG